ncbi:GNAT family acetyltransferase [Marinomonas transparens]|uniref:GNAT family acetyltransferase n=1 Tax=Marinomonas transparens TaxID=2795388 RepID=A0A934N4S3_9GAMM|nr:GNAT family acetyltransferase [Marinomonas transparens]MBJ7536306.1 GNAT family acetyltransferase [Marinomonas transparens]
MLVRRYQADDKEALINLWERVFPNNPKHSQPRNDLEAKLVVDDFVFVVELEGKLVGACMVGYDGHRGWLYAVAVNPDYRRLGVGKKLVEQAIAELELLGCVKVNLQIRETNHSVAEFYRSIGFETEQRLSMGRRLSKD